MAVPAVTPTAETSRFVAGASVFPVMPDAQDDDHSILNLIPHLVMTDIYTADFTRLIRFDFLTDPGE